MTINAVYFLKIVNLCVGHLKLMKYCTSIIPQFKKKRQLRLGWYSAALKEDVRISAVLYNVQMTIQIWTLAVFVNKWPDKNHIKCNNNKNHIHMKSPQIQNKEYSEIIVCLFVTGHSSEFNE